MKNASRIYPDEPHKSRINSAIWGSLISLLFGASAVKKGFLIKPQRPSGSEFMKLNKEQIKKRSQVKQPSGKLHPPVKSLKINRYSNLFGLAIIILLGILVYSNSFNCSFHFDDYQNIVDNTKIRNLSDIYAWWNFYPTRPFGIFTFALNYHFNRLDLWPYHLVNLIIHLINACLIWWLTNLIFSTSAMKDQAIASHKKIIAFMTALLFVSHPLATQSVTYIVQRLASLVAMFYLLSLALYVKARLSHTGKTMKIVFFTGSFLSAILAMLTKENAFTLPFAVVLFEMFFLRTKKLSLNFKDYRVLLLLAAFLGVVIIIPLKVSVSVFKPILPSIGHNYTITPLNYLFTQFSVILKYIQLLIFPVNLKLDYDFPVADTFFRTRTLLSFLVLSGLIILSILLFKKQRIISFGILWFFLTLSIESSIIPIVDVIYEHRTYLPSFGFFLIISSVLYRLLWDKYKYLAIAVFVIIIGLNSYLTFERNKVWKDNLTLWSDNADKTPNLARSISNRGVAYGSLGQRDKAIADCSRAIEIDPKYRDAYFNRGISYSEIGQWDKAIADYSKVVMIDPDFTMAYYNRGLANGNLGQWNQTIADYSRVIGMEPGNSEAFYNRGVAFLNLGQLDKAIADFSKTVNIDPKHNQALYTRGNAYGNLGQWDKAISDYTKAITIDPNFKVAYLNRGVAYGNLDQWAKAITDYTSAIRLDPTFTTAYFDRGVAFGNMGQWDKAVADYSRAIELDPKFTQAYSNRDYANRHLRK